MCGIFGYIGKKSAQEIILTGLSKLEYRGYDSAGISIYNNLALSTVKFKGKLQILADYLQTHHLDGTMGIGHTRWATHGIPSDINSHPHLSNDKKFSLVHNGIIENYAEIKNKLLNKGYTFQSDTDTEVIVNLIQDNYQGNLAQAVATSVKQLEGTYAIVVLSEYHANELIAVKSKSPLIIGVNQQEFFLASDIQAIYPYTKKVFYLENNDIAYIKDNKLTFYDFNLQKLQRNIKIIDWEIDKSDKGDYQFFMLKEIHEQPMVLNHILNKYLIKDSINMPDVCDIIKGITDIYLIACGTAYFAALSATNLLKKITNFKLHYEIASEFNDEVKLDKNYLIIVVSQSGETADTLSAMRIAKAKGAKILAIVNVFESTIAREADYVLYTYAGNEIAVASTKAFSSQILISSLFALKSAQIQNTISPSVYLEYINSLKKLPAKLTEILKYEQNIARIAKLIYQSNNMFYIGRGLDYITCLEGSLKMKEISYIHSEAIPAGELKHGSIALIDNGFPVVVVITDLKMVAKLISNLKEIKARGAYTITITLTSIKNIENISDETIYIPASNKLYGISSVIPLQLLAYYVAKLRDIDIDKPRNLAKSVTVE